MYRWIKCLLLCMFCSASFGAQETAIFAGGGFWALQADFDKLPGVIATVSGFDGDKVQFPTYSLVDSGKTKYIQCVKVIYDKDKLSYRQLVEYYFKHIDPTAQDSQFCDTGKQYRSAIFYLNALQKDIALEVRDQVASKFNTIYTEVNPTTQFYPAEDYHQFYAKKNPLRYKYYRFRCGRDEKILELWGALP